jgi:hypothetical protein
MVTWDCGGGGGFCTFAVSPLLHPASIANIAAAITKSIHRVIATAGLPVSGCIILLVIAVGTFIAVAIASTLDSYCPVPRR